MIVCDGSVGSAKGSFKICNKAVQSSCFTIPNPDSWISGFSGTRASRSPNN